MTTSPFCPAHKIHHLVGIDYQTQQNQIVRPKWDGRSFRSGPATNPILGLKSLSLDADINDFQFRDSLTGKRTAFACRKVPIKPMRVLVLFSSLDISSRSEKLARLYAETLSALGADTQFETLKEYTLPRFDNGSALLKDPSYRALHDAASRADGLVLANPIYNWGCCAELKTFVEVVGTNPPGENVRSPFFDKIITFVNAAGLPQSYMAFSSLAISMMLDFKCIINPYTVYVDNAGWTGETLGATATNRMQKSAK